MSIKSMSKKKKIILLSIAIFLVVAIIATSLTLFFVYKSKGPFSGTVTDAETGLPIANVAVTDGINVVKTDADGKFYLDGYHNSSFVTVTLPSGYNADDFYIPVKAETESYDFKLQKTGADYSGGHSFLQISDTEIGSDSNVDDWIGHVKSLVDELNPAFLIHTGDICYEAGLKRHIEEMNSENMGLPVRYVIGNHDYVKWGGYGEALYESLYGPVWYSFDVGNVHYVVTPFQVGGDVASRYNKNDRWKWLENDLANVDPSMKVVMFNHTTPPSDDFVIKYGTKSFDLKQHNLIAWIYGHYHYNYVEKTTGGVLKISTARPDSGGIDSSASGTRQLILDADGKMTTEMHYYDYAAPTGAPADAEWTNDELAGNALFSDTLVAGDVAYVGTSDDDEPRDCGVYAVDLAGDNKGKTKWFFKTENSVKNNVVITGNILIAQDAAGNVYGLNADTGDQLWHKKVGLGNQFATSSGIVTDGETVFTGCASEITALNVADGDVKWNLNRKKGEASPAEFVLVGDVLLVNSHWDALVALNKNTKQQLWENKDADLRFRSSTPALLDDNTLIVADDDAIMLVNLKNGKISERHIPTDADGSTYRFNVSSQPYVKDGVAFIGTSNRGVIAFDLTTKKIKWKFKTEKSNIFTAPYAGGSSAGVESSFVEKDGCLVFGANDGFLYKIRLSDGAIESKIDVGAAILGKAALYGDQIIVSDFAGRMHSFQI